MHNTGELRSRFVCLGGVRRINSIGGARGGGGRWRARSANRSLPLFHYYDMSPLQRLARRRVSQLLKNLFERLLTSDWSYCGPHVHDANHPPTHHIACLCRYPGVDVRLVPDVAFLLGPLIRVDFDKFKYDILFLARLDKEGGDDLVGHCTLHSSYGLLRCALCESQSRHRV